MKVQIIYLDPHDDHVSARDKLGWVQAPRVLVVWPRHGRVLTRRLDLVLLQRLASQHSVQMGFVTQDPDVLDNAEALSIPCFDSLDHVSERGWRRRARGRPKRFKLERRDSIVPKKTRQPSMLSLRMQRLQGFLRPVIAVVAGLSLLALAVTLIPSAVVHVTPKIERHEFHFSLQLDPDLKDPTSAGSIPAYSIGTRVSDSLRFPTSGKVTVPSKAATGHVILTNLTSDPVTVPAGTGIRASTHGDLRFVTTESVIVPAETDAQVRVAIKADFLGPDGNLPSGAIDAVEGTLGLQLAVQNVESTRGGSNEIRSAVGASDQALLELELIKLILQQAEEEMSSIDNGEENLIPGTMRVVEVFDRTYDRKAGDPADTLSLILDVEIRGYAYRIADLEVGARKALALATSDDVHAVPGSFGYEITGTEITNEGRMSVSGIAWQEVYKPLDEAQIQGLLRAQAPQVAERMLKQRYELEGNPQIQSYPSWLPRLPWLPQRISIRYVWESSG
ncbi:MAG: hypothetical protein GTO14_14700 [Anaerolineales bacterium]|nr:hypothetical protein [Anaerolineales bacterium]